MKLRSKNIIYIIVMMVLQSLYCLSVFATNDPTLTQPLLGSMGEVKIGATSTVTDQPNPFLTVEKMHVINNMVAVGIEQESKFLIVSDFVVTIKLHITTYNQKLQVEDESDQQFIIDYKKAEGITANSMQYIAFKDAYQVKVTVTDTIKNVGWDVTKVLRIDNTLTATRDYVFDCFAGIKGLNAVLDKANNELTATWQDPHTGLTEYDLEWAWIDESALAAYQDNNQFIAEKIFTNNATRITISTIAYNIPLLYDGEGRLFVRVRPVQIKHDGQRIEGAWTWQNNGAPVYYVYSGHENYLNWQASTSFAEEGKRKSVVQYFDGTLRNRQTVTKDNSTGTTVVAESFYDYQGRPVIQVLPAPTLNTIIQYSQNFNKAVNFSGYPKWAYDKLEPNMGICANPAQPLAPTTGTSQYYSPNNEKIKDPLSPDKYIPDAEGYPLTETRFTPDGRVAAQGGVGANHQLGSNHETKYIYESPAQQELDALFGTDAGYAVHYFKNLVKDANGQYSVSYTDMHGRTVATALAGNAPKNLDALPNITPKIFTKQLIDEETNTIVGNSIIATKALAVPKAGLYKFSYELKPEQLTLLNCKKEEICYDCLYNLKITITSDCNSDGFPYIITDSNFTLTEKLTDPMCNDKGKTTDTFNKVFEVQLPEGAYTITKVLTLSDSAKNIYHDVFIANNTCKTFQDFYNTEYKLLLEKSNCAITCESCKEGIGADLAAFTQKFIAESGMKEPLPETIKTQLKTAYTEALKNCDQICYPDNNKGMDAIKSIREVMLMDVTPPYGQYAKPEEDMLQFNIFRPNPDKNNEIPYKFPIPAYKDEFGVVENPDPATYAKDKFVDEFKDSWAEQLLVYHPEYCKLQTIEQKLPATYQFEATLNIVNTWADATNAQYINVVNNVINIINKDPFFSGVGFIYKKPMQQKMAAYDTVTKVKDGCPAIKPTTFSMWQLAQSSVFCRNLSDKGCAASEQNKCLLTTPVLPPAGLVGCSTDWDMAWKSFRTLYLTERKKLISQYLLSACGGKNDDIIKGEKKQLRFINYNNIDYNTLDDDPNTDLNSFFDQLGAGDPNAVKEAEALAAEQYKTTCQSYADTWIAQLEQCPSIGTISPQDREWLVSRLVNICTLGADENHFLGSSSLKPGAEPINDNGNLYTEFPDVIEVFLQNKGIAIDALCHPYLITTPAPYDKQAAVVDQQVITKPDTCECNRLNELQQESITAGYAGKLSEFLKVQYGTNITQEAIDTLLALCSGEYKCIFLPAPIVLPPVMQCSDSIKTCISCEDYQTLKKDFVVAFNQQAPVANPQTQEEIDLNIAFEHFANNKTGFGKSWQDYIDFEGQCGGNVNILSLQLKMFLGGAYDSQTGLMKDDLRKLGLIPLSDPYFTDPMLTPTYLPSANHTAQQMDKLLQVDASNQSIVDWVWVQLHDGKDSCKILATQSGLVQKDGTVVATNGAGAISFIGMPNSNYFVSVRHRNHIGAMTKMPVTINNEGNSLVDFTNIAIQIWGINAQKNIDGKMMLWPGDVDIDKLVSGNGINSDREYLLNYYLNGDQSAFVFPVYSNGDINMNGIINYNGLANDNDKLIFFALDNDPFLVRIEQIPACAALYENNNNNKCNPVDILTNTYYTTFIEPESGYVDLDMRTFAGTKTLDAGPKGVFDINKNLIDNTADGTPEQIKESYVQIWNSSLVNQAVGTLSLVKEKFRLTLKPGQKAPCDGIIGMRFYQFDAPVDTLDGAIVGPGCYIDFGDGIKQSIIKGLDANYTRVVDFTDYTTEYYLSSSSLDSVITTLCTLHYYPDNSPKTVTVYHPDVQGAFGFDNETWNSYPFDLGKLKNLRGYMPQQTWYFIFHSTQDISLNTTKNIINFSEVNSIKKINIANGAFSPLTGIHSTDFSSFGNNHDLRMIFFSMENYPQYPHQKFATLFPDLKNNFPKLNAIRTHNYMGEYTPDIDFSLPDLRFFDIIGGTLTSENIDSCMIQVGRSIEDSSLLIIRSSDANVRTAASDEAYNSLKNRGWNIWWQPKIGLTVNNPMPASMVLPLRDSFPLTNAFTEWYNEQNNTQYSYHQLVALLKDKYGYEPDYCTYKKLECLPPPMLCGLNEPAFKPVLYEEDPCKDLPKFAVTSAEEKWTVYKDSINNVFDTVYYNKCMKAKDMESFTVEYNNSEYHYTLYYYDQAGNLVKTVPPAGVDKNTTDDFLSKVAAARLNVKNGQSEALNKKVPDHTLVTNYRYNTLNQVVAQQTPDAGKSMFWYDLLGRLVVSQNAQQSKDNKFSYTLYDGLGRITEVGQKPNAVAPNSKDPEALKTWLASGGLNKEQVTRTAYDLSYVDGKDLLSIVLQQRNLRNRVSYSLVYDKEPQKGDLLGTHTAATYYSYDIHGNVDTLLQHINEEVMKTSGNRLKKIVYNYDLISGKVNAVHYQSGRTDQFHHKYIYDAENRLTDVYTSIDSLIWQKDARYSYYRHGPLARMIIGQNQVQGVDYAYTLQGWLKGINSTAVTDGFDIGGDGIKAGDVANQVARDAYGFALHYYSTANAKDYKPINNTLQPFADAVGFGFVPLYNGNIAAMSVNTPKVGEALLYRYKYDQLNRLTKMNTYKGLDNATNNWDPISIDDYREEISYDANGNIESYKRNGSAGKLDMDKMTYQYPKTLDGKKINNRLRYVHDEVNAANYAEDIDSQTPLTLAQVKAERLPEQQTDNYIYDAIGNLIQDKKEGINKISWNVYGKITSIEKQNSAITYRYDAAGNRISKTAGNTTTIYLRDASGNVMSTYTVDAKINNGNLTQNEVHLYGSSRLGINEVNRDVQKLDKADYLNKVNTFVVGDVRYELTDHRSNVMAVVSDKKHGVDANNDGIIDYYTADVVSATDYAPFGMSLSGRKFNGGNYRFGFNGKENDKDISNGAQDYGMRIYEVRLGRFLSTDPITGEYPELTPYQFASNTPIAAYDLDGLEAAGMYFPPGVSSKDRDAAIKGYNQSLSGFVDGFAGSAWSTIKSTAALTSTVPTPESMQAKGAMIHAITHPKETLKNIKAGFKQWTNALKSSDPYTRSHALGQGLEFGFEIALPIKGMMGLKSSSMALYEGNKILSNTIKDGVQVVVAKSADDLKYLKTMGAQALYMGGEGTKGSILVAEGASRATILEEAIHHAQRLKYGDKYFYSNVAKLEVEAQSQLFKIGTKEGWKAAELSEITRAKDTWQKVLSGKK